MVGELVALVLADDRGELIGRDEAVVVGIEVLESLSNALALQTSQHLRKLLVGHGVSGAFRTEVEACPRTVEIESQAILTPLLVVDALQVFNVD